MKNILLGFLMATYMFLMIGITDGQTYTAEEILVKNSMNGRYQAFTYQKGGSKYNNRYMLDTQSGELYAFHSNIEYLEDGTLRPTQNWRKVSNTKFLFYED